MQKDKLEIKLTDLTNANRIPTWLNVLALLILMALMLATALLTVYRSEQVLKANVANKLETILQIESEAVRQWIRTETQQAMFLASDLELANSFATDQTLNLPQQSTDPLALEKKIHAQISNRLRNKTYVLMTFTGKLVDSSGKSWLADKASDFDDEFYASLASGKPTIAMSNHSSDAASGIAKGGIVIAAPVSQTKQGIIGFLAIGFDLHDELTRVLLSSRNGKSGETIAVSETGKLISDSRFGTREQELGYFPQLHKYDIENSSTKIRTELRGQLDHRGVNSVSASRWMPRIGIGLVNKMDYAEADAPVNQIRYFVWTLMGLLLLTTLSTLIYRFYIYRLKRIAKQADIELKKLGSYELEGKIGEGGMGVVYRAKHALMRRPTAIKVLPPEKSSPAAIERFEREVKLTSQLKHPNTISVFDYGRTESGLFYYAMELLDGVNLEQLVLQDGPLTDGRVVNVLEQVCHSLREAHALNLIHRDIKPANIMLCDRGGAFDMVKVLDFGMVRDRTSNIGNLGGTLSGTPAYMAPECFADPDLVDQRVDLFAIGAVGYYLLTGKMLFNVNSMGELLRLHRKSISDLARQQIKLIRTTANLPVSQQLVRAITRCLANSKHERTDSIDVLLAELAECEPEAPWTAADAEAWWQSRGSLQNAASDLSPAQDCLENNSSLNETLVFKPPAKNGRINT